MSRRFEKQSIFFSVHKICYGEGLSLMKTRYKGAQGLVLSNFPILAALCEGNAQHT